MDQSYWKRFFDYHSREYMDNVFTRNTAFEVEFLIRELDLKPGQRVVDVGCGTGRHSIQLARYGARMTCIDLSEGMLDQARRFAKKENVHLEFIQADAAEFQLPEQFDHAICLCEGALGLLGADDDPATRDLAILKNIYRCLKPAARFILTVLNGLKMAREHSQKDVHNGSFDPVHLISHDRVIVKENGKEKELSVREKGFAPAELIQLLIRTGFKIEFLGGGTAGSWNKMVLDLDEYEIMVIAGKPVSGIS
jgi:SAM-dependent methyltransferase